VYLFIGVCLFHDYHQMALLVAQLAGKTHFSSYLAHKYTPINKYPHLVATSELWLLLSPFNS